MSSVHWRYFSVYKTVNCVGELFTKFLIRKKNGAER